MQTFRFLKLLGLAVLAMTVLVGISFIEVFLYSVFINPGHEEAFYEAHAQITAPWISAIFGFLLFFFASRYWTKKSFPNLFQLIWQFPLAYVVLDIAILLMIGGIDWGEFWHIFLIANGLKFAGSFAGYFMFRPKA